MALTRFRDGDERLGQQVSVSGRQAMIPAALLVDASGNVVASPAGATDVGDPIKVGGVYNATSPTLTDGQRGNLLLGTRGAVQVQLMANDTVNPVALGGENNDAVAASASVNRLLTVTRPTVFNGTTYDRQRGDTNGLVVQPALSANFWNYAGIAGGIVSSIADVAIKAAAGASVRNYLKSLSISHDVLSAVTEFVIKDGSTIIYRGKLQTPVVDSAAGAGSIIFDPPLRGTANTALNFALITSVTGGVFINAQGYTGA